MNTQKNPVREHWASKQLPAYLAGKYPKTHYTPIYVGRKIVGEVQDDVFLKRLIGSKHFLRVPPGIAFDIDSLKQAEKAGARKVKIIDKETGKIYRAAISTIWAKGFHKNYCGYGPQIGLEMHLWSKGNEPISEQLGLWGDQ